MNVSNGDTDFLSWMALNQSDLIPDFDAEVLNSLPTPKATTQNGNTARRASTVVVKQDLSHLSEAERKKEERKIKNREIAKNCRKRKREKFNAMEKELRQLREDKRNLELRIAQMQNNTVKSLDESPKETETVLPTREARNKEYKEINLLLEHYKEASEQKNKKEIASITSKIQKKLDICREMHSDFGKARKSEIEFHMSQLEQLLIPNQLTKMSLWSLQQEDDFYDEKTSNKTFGGGLWKTICTEFELTKSQKADLLKLRGSIKKQRQNIFGCLKILNELKGRVKENFDSLKSQMQKLLAITTPVQQAGFLMWIEKNQACMHMLNSLWEQEKVDKESNESKEVAEIKVENEGNETEEVSKEAMEAALQTGKALREMKSLLGEKD